MGGDRLLVMTKDALSIEGLSCNVPGCVAAEVW